MASSGGCGSNGSDAVVIVEPSPSPSPSQSPSLGFRLGESDEGGYAGHAGDVPLWKRELIQRRRQLGKTVIRADSAASTSTATALAGARGGAAAAVVDSSRTRSTQPRPRGITPSTPGEDATAAAGVSDSGASCVAASPDMRLEATVDAGEGPVPISIQMPIVSPGPESQSAVELLGNGRMSRMRGGQPPAKGLLDIVKLVEMRGKRTEECESDSSEELQYGPGIVHKLRSKYLNMTLREMNKNGSSGHGFRRATSLEDLLDRNEESGEKTGRRYAKKSPTGAAAKVERYRNAARGNESMKRARSVETLMRYNSALEEASQDHGSRFSANVFRQDSDHIILVDKSSTRIENRFFDKDRLTKPLNKPKRIRPVLAETERPPPDLVKTTMRIFESSSIKKLKPKGDVAVKVATFKTINDTFKAQNQKKIIPKPPIQPKPFVNGNSKISPSPRKIIISRKPTAELIEMHNSQESRRNEGVITESIVQSVSSVVSKFQQIEKSYSPSSSPEPTFNKIKFSPVASPEPSAVKLKVSSLDVKSPMMTPVPSPRTSPPKAQSPLSPRSETIKQPSMLVQKPIMNSTPLSNKFDQSAFGMPTEIPKVDFEQDKDELNDEQTKDTLEVNSQITDTVNDSSKLSDTLSSSGSSTVLVDNFDESIETVDNPRTVSKSALDNIGKAGMTVQFRFNDHPSIKSYLPRSASNPEQIRDKSVESEIMLTKLTEVRGKSYSFEAESVPAISDIIPINNESPNNLHERFVTEHTEETIHRDDHASVIENKQTGAISNLSLIKSTMTTSFPQGNETKTIRSQKSDSNSPPQKQIGIIRPLVSTKTQLPQQNLSNREIEKNLINRVKSIEQPSKVVVSLKSAEEIQPVKKHNSSGGLWDSKPWNQQNNTMVFNFSNRKDVPDYIENDGLIIKRKREKPRSSSNSGVIVSNIDSIQLTDDSDTEASDSPPSPCNIAFCNDNVLINGRSNLSRTPRNHKHRIQFDDTATCTYEYPSEASMLEVDASGTSSDDGETSASGDTGAAGAGGASSTARSTGTLPSLLGGGGLASYTPSKVDLASEGFELGVTRANTSTLTSSQSTAILTQQQQQQQQPNVNAVDYSKPSQDTGTWGQETAADILY
ncbi:PREDICTED: uncharacterized protein LOC105368781 [Ceratosolen solmsi marchali]|uniref:Uncharacterized protein LOC105368781 n=1 Tax=Ceratosolen solmsi marchali TaxID=326594 RepID=A0AAJ6YXG6_9HYME|nr:PREDICTED: uncharacterized protein LOC105368781 [Ceratosolen solmsi marchali]